MICKCGIDLNLTSNGICPICPPEASNSRLIDGLNAKFGNDAIQRCIDIYMDYHVSDIKDLPPATRLAWELGQKAREHKTTGI